MTWRGASVNDNTPQRARTDRLGASLLGWIAVLILAGFGVIAFWLANH